MSVTIVPREQLVFWQIYLLWIRFSGPEYLLSIKVYGLRKLRASTALPSYLFLVLPATHLFIYLFIYPVSPGNPEFCQLRFYHLCPNELH